MEGPARYLCRTCQGSAREHDCNMGFSKKCALQILALREIILPNLLWGGPFALLMIRPRKERIHEKADKEKTRSDGLEDQEVRVRQELQRRAQKCIA